jgi:hypothetical protein
MMNQNLGIKGLTAGVEDPVQGGESSLRSVKEEFECVRIDLKLALLFGLPNGAKQFFGFI